MSYDNLSPTCAKGDGYSGPMKRVMFWRRSYPSWPRVWRGTDENCNPSICLTVWPFGTVIVFWRRQLRTDADGPCEECRADARADGLCEWCLSRPCHCGGACPACGCSQNREGGCPWCDAAVEATPPSG